MSLLKELEGHPDYLRLCNSAKSKRPTIPQWDTGSDNTEFWKEQSAMQKGFDLCLAIFAPHLIK